jgi:hypothetical protein
MQGSAREEGALQTPSGVDDKQIIVILQRKTTAFAIKKRLITASGTISQLQSLQFPDPLQDALNARCPRASHA